jgi:hypothetical protein
MGYGLNAERLRHLDNPPHSKCRRWRILNPFCATAPLAPPPYRGRTGGAVAHHLQFSLARSTALRRHTDGWRLRLADHALACTGDSPMNERAGEHGSVWDDGWIDLVSPSCACILQKHHARSSARVSQRVFASARCVTARTQTRTSDSRRAIAGPMGLEWQQAEISSVSTSRFYWANSAHRSSFPQIAPQNPNRQTFTGGAPGSVSPRASAISERSRNARTRRNAQDRSAIDRGWVPGGGRFCRPRDNRPHPPTQRRCFPKSEPFEIWRGSAFKNLVAPGSQNSDRPSPKNL